MVALELFTLSSMYTAGNLVKYFLERFTLSKGEPLADGSKIDTPTQIEKFLELSVQKSEYHPPFYVNTGTYNSSLGIPVGGGTTTELSEVLSAVIAPTNEYNNLITDLNTRRRIATPQKYWLNTPDDLKGFFEQHKIPQNIIPLSLPLQVREIKIPPTVPVYAVNKVIGTDKKAVIESAVYYRSFGRSPVLSTMAVALTISCGIYLYTNWDDWAQIEKRKRILKAFKFSSSKHQ